MTTVHPVALKLRQQIQSSARALCSSTQIRYLEKTTGLSARLICCHFSLPDTECFALCCVETDEQTTELSLSGGRPGADQRGAMPRSLAVSAAHPELGRPERMELSMLRMSLAAIGLLLALGLGACDEQVTPPQEPAPGAIPPAE